MRRYANLLKLTALSVLIVGTLQLFIEPKDLEALATISWFSFFKILLAAQLVYVISGIEFALVVFFNSGVRLRWNDIFLLPITMNLWSFLIPFQGSLLYSSLILKFKYKTSYSEAVATSIFSYLLAIVITGFFGILFFAYHGQALSPGMIISLLFAVFPAFILIAHAFLQRLASLGSAPFQRLISLIEKIVTNLKNLCRIPRLLGLLFFTNSLHICASFLMNLYAADALGTKIPWESLFMFTLILRLSVILKLTPGNLGIQEIVSGGVFAVLTLEPGVGVLISLLTRLVTIVQMCTLGVIDTLCNTKYFPLKSLFKTAEPSTGNQ